MKIKKEYGLEVFKALNESLNTLTALDRIYDEINHNILVVFVEETNPSFQEIGDMFDYANLMCWFYEELKHNFFDKFVEDGYQEPLYYIHMSPYADGGEYLGINEYTNKTTNCAKTNINLKTKFTEKEIKDKFPIYWGTPLIEEVEE